MFSTNIIVGAELKLVTFSFEPSHFRSQIFWLQIVFFL